MGGKKRTGLSARLGVPVTIDAVTLIVQAEVLQAKEMLSLYVQWLILGNGN